MKILHRRSHGLIFWPRESVGEDSSPTLSWPHLFGTWLMASFFGLVRASAKILRPSSHGLNFWPPEGVGEDFFIDGLVAPPSPSVVLCSRTSPAFLGHFQPSARANSRRENHGPTTEQTDFSALQTSPSTISVLALALESIGEDSSPTLSWPQFLAS